jgi:hypothetical protein
MPQTTASNARRSIIRRFRSSGDEVCACSDTAVETNIKAEMSGFLMGRLRACAQKG